MAESKEKLLDNVTKLCNEAIENRRKLYESLADNIADMEAQIAVAEEEIQAAKMAGDIDALRAAKQKKNDAELQLEIAIARQEKQLATRPSAKVLEEIDKAFEKALNYNKQKYAEILDHMKKIKTIMADDMIPVGTIQGAQMKRDENLEDRNFPSKSEIGWRSAYQFGIFDFIEAHIEDAYKGLKENFDQNLM